MNAKQILNRTSLFSHLPGDALIYSDFEIDALKRAHLETFWYRGPLYKTNDSFIRVNRNFFSNNLISCYGEIFAEFGYENFSFVLFKIDD